MPTGDGVLASAIYRLCPIPIQIVGLEVDRSGRYEDHDSRGSVNVEDSTPCYTVLSSAYVSSRRSRSRATLVS